MRASIALAVLVLCTVSVGSAQGRQLLAPQPAVIQIRQFTAPNLPDMWTSMLNEISTTISDNVERLQSTFPTLLTNFTSAITNRQGPFMAAARQAGVDTALKQQMERLRQTIDTNNGGVKAACQMFYNPASYVSDTYQQAQLQNWIATTVVGGPQLAALAGAMNLLPADAKTYLDSTCQAFEPAGAKSLQSYFEAAFGEGPVAQTLAGSFAPLDSLIDSQVTGTTRQSNGTNNLFGQITEALNPTQALTSFVGNPWVQTLAPWMNVATANGTTLAIPSAQQLTEQFLDAYNSNPVVQAFTNLRGANTTFVSDLAQSAGGLAGDVNTNLMGLLQNTPLGDFASWMTEAQRSTANSGPLTAQQLMTGTILMGMLQPKHKPAKSP